MSEPIDQLTAALQGYRIRFGTEALMQRDVGEALAASGYLATPELPLTARDRIDFYVSELQIGVECKVGGGPSAVLAQLLRYAASSEIDGLILVTRRRAHLFPEQQLGGKPLRIVYVGGSQL